MSESPLPIAPDALLRQAGFVRALAMSLLHDEHLSDDVVQETWLAALEHPPRSEVGLQGWMAKVARNVSLKLHRTRARRASREREASKPETIPPALEAAESESVLRAVTDAVLALEEPYRSTILMRYFEGLAPSKIAERLGLPVATVHSRLQRALAQLRIRLDRAHGGDRSAWSLGLMSFAGVERVAASSSAAAITGASVMSAKAKLAMVGVFLLVGSMGALRLTASWQHEVTNVTATVTPPLEAQEQEPVVRSAGASPQERQVALPEDPVQTTGPFGSLLLTFSWFDGAPAEGIHVHVLPWVVSNPFLRSLDGATDAAGKLRFDRVHAGEATYYPDRGQNGGVRIEAGRETVCGIAIPRGAAIQGLVVDSDDRPVEGAEVLLNGHVVVRTTTEGRFSLRSVTGGVLSARARGSAPSSNVKVQPKDGDVLDVTLSLRGPGGRLQLIVLDPRGKPVEGAKVRVASRSLPPLAPDFGRQDRDPQVLELRTDAGGRIEVDGIAPGVASLQVRAGELAPWESGVDIQAGLTTSKDVQLADGVRVHGTILEPAGGPAPHVRVGVGEYGEFMSSMTSTEADGSFDLDSLGPGEFHVRAGGHNRGLVETDLRAGAGDVLEWNATLSMGRVLRGVLVDEREVPLTGWIVNVRPGQRLPGSFWGQATSDEQGKFLIANCPDYRLRLEAVEPDVLTDYAGVEIEPVEPGPTELRIVVSDKQRLTGFIVGRLIDSAGKPTIARVSARKLASDISFESTDDPETGAFRLGPYPPGRYRITITDKSGLHVDEGDADLTSGQTLDLGALRLPRPGRIRLDVHATQGVELERLWFGISAANSSGCRGVFIRSLEGTALPPSIDLAPGSYILDVTGVNAVAEEHAFTITADQETFVEITPSYGTQRVFRFTQPEGDLPAKEVSVSIIDDKGRTVVDHKFDRSHDRLLALATLAPGRYHVVGSTDEGLRGEADVTVDSSDSGQPIEIALR